MPSPRTISWARVIKFLAGILILKVMVSVVLKYGAYWPPNFAADFLRGREPYFFGSYQWAFYAHIVTGPVSLALGLLLVSDYIRRKWPKWHKTLGRIQGFVVLLVVAQCLDSSVRDLSLPRSS